MPRLLGETTKTGVSFGLASGPINTGGTCLATACSGICQKCYTLAGGHYEYRCVKEAHIRRLAVTKTDDFVPMMVDEFASEAGRVQRRGESVVWFRGHDSGDFYSLDYISKWTSIVQNVRRVLRNKPVNVRYWFPTRTWIFPKMLPALKELNAEQGVAVKPSALEIGQTAPVISGLALGTAVAKGWGTCPAINNSFRNRKLPEGKKLPSTCKGCKCRRCWSKLGSATYRLH